MYQKYTKKTFGIKLQNIIENLEEIKWALKYLIM